MTNFLSSSQRYLPLPLTSHLPKTLPTTRRNHACAPLPQLIAHRSTSLLVRCPPHQTLLQLPCSNRRHPMQPRVHALTASSGNLPRNPSLTVPRSTFPCRKRLRHCILYRPRHNNTHPRPKKTGALTRVSCTVSLPRHQPDQVDPMPIHQRQQFPIGPDRLSQRRFSLEILTGPRLVRT